MKKLYSSTPVSVVASLGATPRDREPALVKHRVAIARAAGVSLIAFIAACGSYASSDAGGTAGSGNAMGGSQNTTAGSTSSAAGTLGSAGMGMMGTAGSMMTSGGSTGTAGDVNSSAGSGSGGGAPPAAGAGGGSSAGGPSTGTADLPCAIMAAANSPCVSAHSTVRVIVPNYSGPLYQLCKGTASAGPSSCKGTMQDIGAVGGYADSAMQDTFCSGATCTITKIYDQSGKGNDLEPAPRGGAKGTPDNPAKASALKVMINGHPAYGILIKDGIGYRTGCSGCNIKTGLGIPKGDDPESMYWVTSGKDLVDGCCFDYGNAETTANDDGNGTMEALYFGGGVVWGTGYGGKPGPWIMADLENGLYAGWISAGTNHDKDIPTNKPLKMDFVSGVVLGDTKDKNGGKGRFALYGGDATTGTIQEMYDGIRPEKAGYVPMQKQGSIILGIGGDNSNGAGGRFYEGALGAGPVLSKEVVDKLQAAIVAAKYSTPP